MNPEYSAISPEEWPFLLSGFEVVKSIEELFPKIVPIEVPAKEKEAILNGFKVYTKNCLACHRLNAEGTGTVGPDLNLPMSPTEYFKDRALKKLIREPRSVRTWQGSMMPGFSTSSISDIDLNHLILYLGHMAKSRKANVSPHSK